MFPRRLAAVAAVLALVGGACTPPASGPDGPRAREEADGGPRPGGRGSGPPALHVVADLSPGPGRPARASYLGGMRLAAAELAGPKAPRGAAVRLVVRDHGGSPDRAGRLILDAVRRGAAAVLHVGPSHVLTGLRPALERADVPVVLLEGDLYSGRGLFREVFQTTIPWAWQAREIARYVALDRRARRIAFLGSGPEAPAAAGILRDALRYWGGTLATTGTAPDGGPMPGLELRRAVRGDWVVAFAPPGDALELASAVHRASEPGGPGVTGNASLLATAPGLPHPRPGASACYPYTWAGWALPIPRVRGFVQRFSREFGRPPSGLEQEGYDAVRVLALALARTGGAGGRRLVAALERTRAAFSGFPVSLGPDDHLFAPRDELGLFAVPGPGEPVEPWQDAEARSWRPLMRTFTYDGRRTNILERDRRVFFPSWRRHRPGPPYWRSRYGIVTRPRDPLH